MARTIIIPLSCDQLKIMLSVMSHILLIFSIYQMYVFEKLSINEAHFASIGVVVGFIGALLFWIDWLSGQEVNGNLPQFKCKCKGDEN